MEVEVLLKVARLVGKVGVKPGGGDAGGAEGAAAVVLLLLEFVELLLRVDELLVIPGVFILTAEFELLAIVLGGFGVEVGLLELPVVGVLLGMDLFVEELLLLLAAVAVDEREPEADGLANSNSPCCPL